MTCNRILQGMGAAYPRTCAECGLGPCNLASVANGDSADAKPAHTVTSTVGGNTSSITMLAPEPLLRFFAYEHLPPHLQAGSKPFADLARHIADTTPRSAERTVALRKLLEAKDANVRACLPA